jgi:hypothetical protein
MAAIHARAATLADPLRRDAYLEGPPPVRALLAQAGRVTTAAAPAPAAARPRRSAR